MKKFITTFLITISLTAFTTEKKIIAEETASNIQSDYVQFFKQSQRVVGLLITKTSNNQQRTKYINLRQQIGELQIVHNQLMNYNIRIAACIDADYPDSDPNFDASSVELVDTYYPNYDDLKIHEFNVKQNTDEVYFNIISKKNHLRADPLSTSKVTAIEKYLTACENMIAKKASVDEREGSYKESTYGEYVPAQKAEAQTE